MEAMAPMRRAHITICGRRCTERSTSAYRPTGGVLVKEMNRHRARSPTPSVSGQLEAQVLRGRFRFGPRQAGLAVPPTVNVFDLRNQSSSSATKTVNPL